jgi:PAS domain S-box-containing protein
MSAANRSARTNWLGYLLILGVLVAGGALGLRNVANLATTVAAVAHTHEVLSAIDGVMSTLKDAETGQRGFLLVRDDRYLEPFRIAMATVGAAEKRLGALVADNPTQVSRVNALAPKVAIRLVALERTIELAKRNDQTAAMMLMRSDSGTQIMDGIRADLSAMAMTETALLDQRRIDSVASRQFANASILLSGLIGAALIGVVTILTGKRIRDQRAADDIIADQGERFRTTLASIGDAVITTDTEGRVESMNEVAEALTGWSTADAKLKPLAEIFRIVNESTRKTVGNPVEKALRDGTIVGLANHTILIARNDEEHFIDDSASPIRSRNGTITGCVLIFRDIGEQKHSERAIAESEARFRRLSDNIAPLAWIADTTGRISWCSKRCTDYTGLTPEALLGWGWQQLHHPDYVDGVTERFFAAIEMGEGWEDTFPLRGADGLYRWFLSRATPIRDEHGAVVQWIGSNTDITVEREALESLQLSDLRYRSALEAVNSLIWTNDASGRMVGDQPWWAAFTGQTLEEYQGFGWAGAVHPDDAQPTIAAWNDAVASRTMFVAEHRVRRRDGEWRTCTIKALPVLRSDGEVYEWVGVHTDVTDARAAAAREQNLMSEASIADAKFRALFDQGAYLTAIVEPDGTIVEPNRQSWESTGFSRDDIVGKKFWEGPWWAKSADLSEKVRQAAAEAATGKIVRRELPYFVADGSQRIIDMIIVPIRDEQGQVTFLAPTGSDITERVEAQRLLRASVEAIQRLASIVASSADAIIGTNLDGVVTNWNSAATQILGFSESDIVGKPIAVLMPPELGSGEGDIMDKVVRGESVTAYDTVRLGKSGARVPLSITISPIADDRGLLIGASTIARDITERKQVEERLRRSEEELRTIASALSEADHRKDEFLATLAHELRNPLAPIRNGLQIMRLASNDPATMARSQAMIERQIEHLVRLVDDLMDISRISRGTITLRAEKLDLASVLRHAVETSRPLIDEKNLSLKVATVSDTIPVLGDRTRLTQVFANLLNNAARYTDRGGTVSLDVTVASGVAEIRIRDTGVGIPREMLTEIFEMFSQVDRSLERSQSGLGIGLTLVKRLTEMHGGRVEATSEGLGKGSEFVVRLPLSDHTDDIAALQTKGAATAATRRRVLVVDDNIDSAQSLGSLLAMMGHEVGLAHDGLEALSAAESFRPDVVMMDIGMPRLNGYEACRAIRSRPWATDVRIIALTGWGQPGDRQRSLDAGFDQHLVKPVDPGALGAIIDPPTHAIA